MAARFCVLITVALASFASLAAAQGQGPATVVLPPAASRKVDFVRDIQPILAEKCNHCHGEDEQEGQLRLDARAIVLKGGKSGPLFVAGQSAESLLVQRLVGLGGQKRMPLEDEPLSDDQVGLIRAWIDQGAVWPEGVGSAASEIKKHWAYVAPVSPALPAVRNTTWLENAIDSFVLARLEQVKLAPSPPADRERLLRRVSLDLIGLPPSIAEADSFLADKSPDAYERVIDRLAASPRYGERWATPWLDAARYADSNGYQRDGHRTIWPYRDYVIGALNADLPFDQFTIEQLAGDLLPNATVGQQIATGFHRCTTVNVEAGTDEEENRVNQVLDRVNVTATVWLGTTLECCQCHDHKYDPFTQRDYYSLFAFFNNSPKETYQRTQGSAALDFGGPELKLPADPAQIARRTELTSRQQRLEVELEQCLDDEMTGLAAWEREMAASEKAAQAKLPANIKKLLAIAAVKRNKNQQAQVRKYFVNLHPAAKHMQAQMDDLQKQLEALSPPATLVMNELDERRMTTIFKRGDFLSPGEPVEAAPPKILPAMKAELPKSRLGLAAWLCDPANPLTPRVQVNRAWAEFFGRGLVASEEDLGTQADPASHPQLLDWLAVEFRGTGNGVQGTGDGARGVSPGLQNGAGGTEYSVLGTPSISPAWSMKRIHRRIVESATYRQSSRFRSDLVNRDPYNVLLARGPRMRLNAEYIRDNALAVSRQLASKMAGPPVYPQQPEGVWRVTGLVDNTYRTSQGADGHRRGVYTVQRRSAPYPSFSNFDAPDRSACMVKRPSSNTPLQALTLQNDPVFVEAARALADLVCREVAGQPLPEKLTFVYRAVLVRHPDDGELAQLRQMFEVALGRYAADQPTTQQVVGERLLPANTSAPEWAAWFNLAHILLNLDETITKN